MLTRQTVSRASILALLQVLALSCLLLFFVHGTLAQQIVNGGFETGDLRGWEHGYGEAAIEDASFGSGPISGKYDLLLRNDGDNDNDWEIEAFLELPAGSLDNLGGNATSGAAVKTYFVSHAGQVLSLKYNFLTDEFPFSPTYNDFAFVVLVNLTEIANTFTLEWFSLSPFFFETGFETFEYTIPKPGRYLLGIGVMDRGDTMVDSGLLVDDVMLTLPQMDSDRNVGLAPVIPTFFPSEKVWDYRWTFGDKAKEVNPAPCHTYWDAHPTYDNIPYDVGFNGIEIEQFVTVYGPSECSYMPLQFVAGSPSHATEDWSNAVDGDTYLSTGLASVTGDGTGNPWAIFEFTDQSMRQVCKLRMMNDVNVGRSSEQVSQFKVYVSTTGTADGDFTLLLEGRKDNNKETIWMNDDWSEWQVEPTLARYIKLVIESPQSFWRLLGEFEVYGETVLADAGLSTLEVSGNPAADGVETAAVRLTLKDGTGVPVEGKTSLDLKLYSLEKYGQANYENECTGTDVFSEIRETSPGVYEATMSSTKEGVKVVRASVNGVIVSGGEVRFGEEEVVAAGEVVGVGDNRLVFVEGTPTSRDEGWDNAVDGDVEGFDGTTTARGGLDMRGPAWAIYRFADNGVYEFDRIVTQTDNGPDDDDVALRQASVIEVLVSERGMAEGDFRSVVTIRRQTGEELWSNLGQMLRARYVKLVLHQPNWTSGGWRQIVEFGLQTGNKKGAELARLVTELSERPMEYVLAQNYPNPFNAETTIRYSLAEGSRVLLKIYDMTGREVATLVDGYQGAGWHSVGWDASQMASGIYFCQLRFGEHASTRRMVLLK
jgi:hypothetical protein